MTNRETCKMTNKEAIETLKSNYPASCYSMLREAVDTAIAALIEQDTERSGANDFSDAVKPVHDWLRENGHPHMIVVVDLEGAQAFEGVAATPFVVQD